MEILNSPLFSGQFILCEKLILLLNFNDFISFGNIKSRLFSDYLKSFKPEPVSPPTRIPLNVQTKAQLKISRIQNQSNPQNTKNTTKFGPKSPHLNRTLGNKP